MKLYIIEGVLLAILFGLIIYFGYFMDKGKK